MAPLGVVPLAAVVPAVDGNILPCFEKQFVIFRNIKVENIKDYEEKELDYCRCIGTFCIMAFGWL